MLTLPQTTDQIGRYQILSELGRGSMGQVYLALDPNIDRHVALKVFLPLLKVQAKERYELRRRFILEAKAAGRVEHPGIVTIFDADTDPATDLSYIAMEWIDGRSLQEVLAETGPPDPHRTVEIIEQVALALDAAHRQGLVHRDVKPANILCGREGVIKVTDFGIAKLASMSITHSNWIPGSPFYMSPEQLRNENVDHRSDIYSLGAVLYECLTGSVPFEGDSLPSLTYMILEIDPRPPQTVDSGIDQTLARVAMRALSKSPDERFQSAIDFARALRGIEPPIPIRTAKHRVGSGVTAPTPTGTVVGSAIHPITSPIPVAAAALPVEEPPPAAKRRQTRPLRTGRAPFLRWAALVLVLAAGMFGIWYGAWSADLDSGEQQARSEPLSFASPPDFPPSTPFESVLDGLDPDLVPAPPEVEEVEVLPAEPVPRPTYRPPPPRAATRAPAPTPDSGVAATDLGTESASSEAVAAQSPVPEPVAAPEPRPVPMGNLEIVYRNRLKAGTISVRLNDRKIWTKTFTGAKSFFKRSVGKDIWATLAIPAGDHVLDVRVTGAEAKKDLVRRTEISIAPGETRRLRVVMVLPKTLKLQWKKAPGG